MPSASVTAWCCLRMVRCAVSARLMSFARKAGKPHWRIYSLRSPDLLAPRRAPIRPLVMKEVWEIVSGRALWTLLLILSPLVGYSFVQAVVLYSEASSAARDAPALASGLSPLDGVLVPSFGALYLAVTLLFPFVAIRVLGREKETGALRLSVQLPYRSATLIAAKMAAIGIAWLIAVIPALSGV